jgi:hypothetical protein
MFIIIKGQPTVGVVQEKVQSFMAPQKGFHFIVSPLGWNNAKRSVL